MRYIFTAVTVALLVGATTALGGSSRGTQQHAASGSRTA